MLAAIKNLCWFAIELPGAVWGGIRDFVHKWWYSRYR
jgi:hypothetical protein